MHLHTSILEHLATQSEPVTVAHVARALSASAYDTRAALHDLVDAGEVVLVRSGGHGERFSVEVPPAA